MTTQTPQQEHYCYSVLEQVTKEAVARSYRYDNNELQGVEYQNATILPAKYVGRYLLGGCITEEGAFVPDSGVPDMMGDRYDCSKVQDEMECAIYGGFLFNCYGHMIGDCLRWAWFATTAQCKALLQQGVPWVGVSNDPLQPYQRELLRLAGIAHFQRITMPTKVKRLIIPQSSLQTVAEQNYWSPVFNDTIERMIARARQEVTLPVYDKIYLTRLKWKCGGTFGERQIADYLRAQGFKVISPEKLSIAQQIVLLNNASQVVATECSLSHQMLFCRPKTICYVLRKNLHLNKYSLFINEMRQLKAHYVDCSLSLFLPSDRWWEEPHFVYANSNLRSALPPPKKQVFAI